MHDPGASNKFELAAKQVTEPEANLILDCERPFEQHYATLAAEIGRNARFECVPSL